MNGARGSHVSITRRRVTNGRIDKLNPKKPTHSGPDGMEKYQLQTEYTLEEFFELVRLMFCTKLARVRRTFPTPKTVTSSRQLY